VQSERGDAGIDLAELAARFSAHGGGHVSPELSTDLALEVVLNEIVEQACLATGAIGAAIVLWRKGELVCRASSGATAPELGSRINPAAGIIGECIRTQRTQRCDDVLADTNADASSHMGVRSVMAMPIMRETNLLGVFELFSGRAYAFGDRDERTLEALVSRTLANLDQAEQPLVKPAAEAAPASEPEPAATPLPASYEELRAVAEPLSGELMDNITIEPEPEKASILRPDSLTLMLGVAVLVCAVLLGVLVGRHFGLQPASHARASAGSNGLKTSGLPSPSVPAASVYSSNTAPANNMTAAETPSTTGVNAPAASSPARQKPALELTVASSPAPAEQAAPAGGLAIFQNGREIYRLRAGQAQPQIQYPQNQTPKHASPVQNKAPLTPAAERTPVTDSSSAPTAPANTAPAPANPAPANNMPAAQPAAPPQAEVFTLPASEVEQNLVVRIEPEYPAAALQQNVQGAVVLRVRVSPDGTVEDVQTASGAPQLVDAATTAVKQWKFRPHLVNGSPVPMQTEVTLNFTQHE
jgi:TonB family protein